MTRTTRLALSIVFLAAQLCTGCTITRLYGGVQLRGDPAQIVAGESTRADVLRILGPPDSIEHQVWGDAFIYRYRQVNSSSITIDDFFFTGQTLFSYSRTFDNSDTLVVLFDFDGIVNAIAADRDTEEMPLL
jgi:outer membrane protein assembly factor BamE (lipoprotein component of BamABCDE complex)